MKRRLLACLAIAGLCLGAEVTPAVAATPRQRLANVIVPAYCRMPAQRLHNGQTAAKYLPASGGIEFRYAAAPISVHLGTSGTQLLAQYRCGAGGVSWPEVLVLYSSTNRFMSSVQLARYAPVSEHVQVDSWRAISGHRVSVSWRSYDGCCYNIRRHRSTLTLSGTSLRLR